MQAAHSVSSKLPASCSARSSPVWLLNSLQGRAKGARVAGQGCVHCSCATPAEQRPHEGELWAVAQGFALNRHARPTAALRSRPAGQAGRPPRPGGGGQGLLLRCGAPVVQAADLLPLETRPRLQQRALQLSELLLPIVHQAAHLRLLAEGTGQQRAAPCDRQTGRNSNDRGWRGGTAARAAWPARPEQQRRTWKRGWEPAGCRTRTLGRTRASIAMRCCTQEQPPGGRPSTANPSAPPRLTGTLTGAVQAQHPPWAAGRRKGARAPPRCAAATAARPPAARTSRPPLRGCTDPGRGRPQLWHGINCGRPS